MSNCLKLYSDKIISVRLKLAKMLPELRDKMKDKDKANIGLVELIAEKFSTDKEKVVKEEIFKSIKIINQINFKDKERKENLMK